MAIADVKEYTHLTEEDVEQLGRELDAIRAEIEESRCDADAAYINKLIKIQRLMMVAARVTMIVTPHLEQTRKPGAIAGGTVLGLAKILENMEIGHNVMHGQWDWMNDPEIHSSNWEWDTAQPAEQWKHSHNYVHHQFTNVLGHDNDIGYGVLRMAREQKWHPVNLGQPVYNALLAGLFQWGVALHDLDIERVRKLEKDPKEMKRQLKQIFKKGRNQALKDYVIYPALAGKHWRTTLTANAYANFMRNIWSYMIIFCGHFPDGAMHFTEEELEDETRAEWYLRQMLGSANFQGGPLLHVMSGSLGYQIEHHLFPDLPSNRYPEIAVKVQALCDKYNIPYTTGPLYRQYGQTFRTIMKLTLPNHMTKDDQPRPPSGAEPAPIGRRRKTDAERPRNRMETGELVAERFVSRSVRAAALTAADPFAWTFEGDESPPEPERLNGPRVTQCALARICGVCAEPLGRPVAFVGTDVEVGRNAFHAPPLHVVCAEEVRRQLDPSWALVETAGFEFVRPLREQEDRRPVFEPNSLL